ncbi:MAG: phosphatidate cytidylyltransferase [candidate division Zixibacteria bacterium]|nr:phosphatidate cytidylyltransferase [candidate division Zixibacteria bacterium]
MSRNLALRLLVAAIGIPALIAICYYNGIFLLGFTILLVGLGSIELSSMLRKRGYYVNNILDVLLPILCILAAYYNYQLINVLLISFLLISLVIVKHYFGKGDSDLTAFLGDLSANMLPVLYIGFLSSFIIYLGKLPETDGLLLIFIFLIVWATDTAAYFGGKTFGKHKLTERLSPKKTWEGFYSGFIGAIIAAVVSMLVFLPISWIQAIVISIVACFFGQLGDLIESGLKRHCRIKDSSAILPGHGGILDRFDSFFFAAPAVYLIMSIWK